MSLSKSDQRKNLALRDPKLASANLIAFIVAACGGGGGGSSAPTPVIPSNSSPNAGVDTTISLSEDVTAGALNLSTPTDSDGDTLAISVTSIPTSGTLNKTDGTLVANGDTLTSVELESLTFTPDANTNGTDYGSFSYSVSDGNGGTDSRTISFSVDAVNDAPDAGVVITELAPEENTTELTTFTATDIDGDTLTYSISGGADQALFQIDSATGVLTFISAPDYENPLDADTDNVYDVQVSATDPNGASTSLSYVITVNNVSEPETVTGTVVDGYVSGATVKLLDATGNVLATTTTDENGQYTLEAAESIGTRIVVDGGIDTATGEAVTITLSASKTSKYVSAITTIIDQAGDDANTVLTNLNLPTDFDLAEDNPLETVAVQKVNAQLINIIAVGESLLEGAGIADNAGDELVVAEIINVLKEGKSLSATATVTEIFSESSKDTIAENRVSELVASVTESVISANEVIEDATDITGIAEVQKLVLDDDGGIAADIYAVAEDSAATYTAETKSFIEQVLSPVSGGITPTPTPTPTDVTPTPTPTDIVNEPPDDLAIDSSSVNENSFGAAVGTLSVTDPENDDITYSISGTDKNSFELDGTTLKLKDTISADFENDSSFSITITATDTAENSVSKDFTISIKDVNEAPSITSLSSSALSENTSAVLTLTSTDPDSDTLAYSISGGDDASLFTINSASGALSFATAPDYETPLDSDKNNTYSIQVTATDPDGLTNTQTVSVVVTDVNETISGKLIDGYIGGATVFQDLDNDAVLDEGEPYTTTDATGAFSLTLQSPSPDAPVRVVNSGFDTATNDVLTASLDISATSSGSYILTPLSTLSARLLSFDSDLYKDDAEQIVADAFGIDLANAPSNSLFGYDPIAIMIGDDPTLASKAQPIYAANQLLMTLGNLTSALGEYLGQTALSSVQTAIQTVLDNASKSATASLSWGDTTTLKSESHEAFINGLAEYLGQHKAGINGFRLDSYPQNVILTDYLSSDENITNIHQVYLGNNSNTLIATLRGSLDQTNLSNIVSSNSSLGKSPVLSFSLNSIPAAGESGTASITMKLYDGSDATQASGERLLQTTVSVNWSSDGSTVSITLPPQSLSIDYFTTDGTLLQRSYDNIDNDILSIKKSSTSAPTLDIKLASFFSGKGEASGVDLSDYITSGNYFFDLELTGLDFFLESGTKITKFQGAFKVDSEPEIVAYINDVDVNEASSNATIKVSLSRASDRDITIEYTTKAYSSALSNIDFKETAGTLSISAGQTTAEINVPLINDTNKESDETFWLEFSNPVNVLIYDASTEGSDIGQKASVIINIRDSEPFIDYPEATSKILFNTIPLIEDYLTTHIKSLLNSNSLTIDGISKTYASILSDYGSITDLESWIKIYTDKTSGGWLAPQIKSFQSFISAIDTYFISATSGSPTSIDLATALTKINAGIKAIDFSQILGGTLINDSGTFANGVTQSSFDTNLSGKVTSVINLAADTIGDVLGTDTATNFPNATIKILTSGNDTANGTSGSDLIASLNGADTVNALGGNDKIIGGSGVDTFDGGEGDDHIYGYLGNDDLTGGTGNDKIVGGLGDDTLTGGEGNDTLWGQTGNDTITTGAGSNDVDGGLGDDTFYVRDKSGSFTDTIKGSAGTDTLDISYSGITSLKDFTLSSSGDEITLTDASGGSITFSNIENLTVNSIAYLPPPPDLSNSVDGGLSNAFYSTAEKSILSYGQAIWYVQNLKSNSDNYIGFGGSDDVTFVGSSSQETLNLNINRTTEYSGNLTITMGDGNDSINSAKLKNTDSIDMGAGDDTVVLMINGSYGTPTIGAANFTKLDGGAGTDTLSFEEGTPDADTELTLTTGGAVNFENLKGGSNAEVLKGDNNANVLEGNGGADTLYGYGGNDTLWADTSNNGSPVQTGSQTSADILYGGAGDDSLHGNDGDNILDGGTGADTIYSGGGSDMIILRSGDGGTTQSAGDTLADFTDGTDSLGLDSSLTFNDLTIEQSGSDTVIKEGSNYLAILTEIAASNISILDFQSTDSSNQTINGTSGNDALIGGAGGDTFNGGAGSDSLVGWNGNDTFNIRSKTGSYADTVNGGAGTDTLDISYSGITSLKDFTLSSSGDEITLTDASGGSITFSNIENLTVNSIAYLPPPSDLSNSVDGGLSNAFYSTAEKSILSYGQAIWYVQNLKSNSDNYIGFGGSDDVTFVGSSSQETLNLFINRTTEYSGNLTITMGDGNDSINSAKLKNTDSIDMGAGDDTVVLMINGSYGTPTIGAANFTKLDGGAGTDTLSFEEGTPDADTELTLTTGGAVNFENLKGGSNAEVLKGDNNANVLEGNGGADTLYGYGGNDTLWADTSNNGSPVQTGSQTSADILYGGAGDDSLHGNDGDNILDGGTGADTIYSGGGSDTIVIRSGDGSTSLATSPVVKDFTDSSDILGMDSLSYSDLTIEQGTGDYANHTLVKITSSDEYLLILENISASNINVLDFSSTSTDALTLNGTSGDDGLVGGAGGDTFNGGAGSDTLLGFAGNDTFNIRSKTGSYADTVNGGAGTDTLDISYSGITSLKDFTLSSSGDEITLTDASGGSITFSNIENLTVNSIAYLPPPSDLSNSVDGGLSNAFYSTAEKSILSYGQAIWYVQNLKSNSDNYIGFGGSDDVTFVGSSSQETLNLFINRTTEYSGNLTITMGDGNDSINSAKLKNTDSIDMGAGDDTVVLMINGSYGTPTIGAANFTKLDGGAGTDTLSFEEGTPDADTELTLTTGGAVNFENLKGGSNAEVLKGDNNANVLEGNGGADTLYGYGGNDTLWADTSNNGSPVQTGSQTSADILYGGAGDDSLHGNDGDNILDGGTGADTIYSGGGVDTFVLRVGSGGTAITDADTFKDFTDGTDLIGLDNGLTFGDLTIEQGTGDYSNHTIIKAGSEYLAIVENITASDLTESSFTPVDINETGHMIASGFFNTSLSNNSLDIDFSNLEQLPIDGISSVGGDFSIDGLIDLEVADKIELTLKDIPESWLEDPSNKSPHTPQVEEPISHFIEDRYEEDILFVSLEI